MSNKEESNKSIYTDSEESETEVSNEIIETKGKSKLEQASSTLVPAKKKRVMTKEHLEKLAQARIKAREVLKSKTSISKARKEMKKEHILLKQLELERDLEAHNQYKKKLLVEGGLVKETAEIKKPKVKKAHIKQKEDYVSEDEDDLKIKELEKQLNSLKVKKKPAKKVVEESESESESEVEEVIVKKKKKKVIIDPIIPIYKDNVRESKEQAVKDQIRLLFPDF